VFAGSKTPSTFTLFNHNTITHTMKTIFFSLLSIAFTSFGSYARQSNEVCCHKGCSAEKLAPLPSNPGNIQVSASSVVSANAESYSSKLKRIEDSYEDQKGYLNFSKMMFTALNQVETEKHLAAVEDLKGEFSYNSLMNKIFMEVEAIKLAEASENEQATEQFNQLMQKTLLESSRQ
jgi:hypothetical protein